VGDGMLDIPFLCPSIAVDTPHGRNGHMELPASDYQSSLFSIKLPQLKVSRSIFSPQISSEVK
jgi:hypothetical protein